MSNTIAIIPSAGKAKRLSPLPFSKELYPVGIQIPGQEKAGLKVISSFLLESLIFAGVANVHFVIRPEKNDIPEYYKGGKDYNCNIAYHVADYEYGVPYSINQVYPFVKDNNVAFGFPDIYIEPLNIFARLIDKFNQNKNADVLLGLAPIPDYKHWDMIETGENSKVKRLMLHSENGKGLKYGWAIAIWRPSFTKFLKNFVKGQLQSFSSEELNNNEHSIGYVFQKAIDDGMNIYGAPFDEAVCLDAGTYQGIVHVMSKIRTNQNKRK